MSRAIRKFCQLLVSPFVVPRLRKLSEQSRPKLFEVARKHGLTVYEEDSNSIGSLRMVGRLGSHAVLVEFGSFPVLRVLFHYHREIELGFDDDGQSFSGYEAIPTNVPGFKNRFRTARIGTALLKRCKTEQLNGLTAELLEFAHRRARDISDLMLTNKCVVAAIDHFLFVPTISAELLDSLIPELVGLAQRCESTFGRSSDIVIEKEFLLKGEVLDDPPELRPESMHELLQ